jgi:hypothetical protein
MSEFFGPTGRKLLKRVGNTEEEQENFYIKKRSSKKDHKVSRKEERQ